MNNAGARIARLLQPFVQINPGQLRQTSMYIDILRKWNARVNLTAIRGEEDIVTRHFGESFFAAAHLLAPDSTLSVIDLGSGAGFPGLPMAIYAPQAKVTLIESNSKKTAFLNEVIAALELRTVMVFNGRAQAFAGTADVVTMRAVESFENVLPLAADLVCDGGRLALMIGASQLAGAEQTLPDFSWQKPKLVPGSRSRVLAVGIKQVKVE